MFGKKMKTSGIRAPPYGQSVQKAPKSAKIMLEVVNIFSQSEPPPFNDLGGMQMNVGRYEVKQFSFSKLSPPLQIPGSAPEWSTTIVANMDDLVEFWDKYWLSLNLTDYGYVSTVLWYYYTNVSNSLGQLVQDRQFFHQTWWFPSPTGPSNSFSMVKPIFKYQKHLGRKFP